jgi:hypothetical protein
VVYHGARLNLLDAQGLALGVLVGRHSLGLDGSPDS